MIDAAVETPASVPGSRLLTDAEFDGFYRRTSRAVWAYLRRMTQDDALADDLAQRSFMRLLKTPVDTGDEARMRGLLYRIATNLAIDQMRRLRRERDGWRGWLGFPRAEKEPSLRTDVERAFAKVPARERALLWLAYVEGFDHREIAAIARVEPGSVKVLLFRARRRLESVLRAMGMGPEVLS